MLNSGKTPRPFMNTTLKGQGPPSVLVPKMIILITIRVGLPPTSLVVLPIKWKGNAMDH